MLIFIPAILLATIQALVCAYFLMQAIKEEEGRTGSLIYSGIAACTTLFLFTIAALHV
ncbi:hypothetical protein [Spirosoma foliorum]|uniref:Uncharacterized protein n=1 Tax=Spirosoma foliorum TaxID=2710596 RepID=A0A7G5H2G8_9BACT|nr:hypothetical protein [Spirosoma foliorum]QMW05310.1 hypothetical protein H3H32_10695 [Spirosoma foliorum]